VIDDGVTAVTGRKGEHGSYERFGVRVVLHGRKLGLDAAGAE
jgi:hypothetical protein